MSNPLRINDDMWKVIEQKYNDEHYTNAILDSINYLGSVVREKSNSTLDGDELAKNVFSPNNPKIKLNKLSTKTEKSIQMGMMDSIAGLYKLVRNPRSHGLKNDSKKDADAIIRYVDFLLGQINVAKSQFSVEAFANRVYDFAFQPKKRYAELLIKEIPKAKIFETLLYLVSKFDDKPLGTNYTYLFKQLVGESSEEELKELYSLISNELNVTPLLTYIYNIITCLPSEKWTDFDEVSRLRIEGMIKDLLVEFETETIPDIDYLILSNLEPILDFFHNKDEVIYYFTVMLCSDCEGDVQFATIYCWNTISKHENGEFLNKDFVDAVKCALSYERNSVYLKLSNTNVMHVEDSIWSKHFSEEYNNYSDDMVLCQDIGRVKYN